MFVFLHRFIINFKTGSAAGDDIAFHYNLQIGECTALNSFKSGKWEMQEKTSDEPFARGGVFQIIFVINSEGYEVCFFFFYIIIIKNSFV